MTTMTARPAPVKIAALLENAMLEGKAELLTKLESAPDKARILEEVAASDRLLERLRRMYPELPLNKEEEAPATVEQWAGLDFEPIDSQTLEDIKPVSNERWAEIGRNMLPSVRVAWLTLSRSKAELKEILDKLGVNDGDAGCALIEDLADAKHFFERYAEMLTSAETRCLSVASAIELEPPPAA
jgi:hypothetical protein